MKVALALEGLTPHTYTVLSSDYLYILEIGTFKIMQYDMI